MSSLLGGLITGSGPPLGWDFLGGFLGDFPIFGWDFPIPVLIPEMADFSWEFPISFPAGNRRFLGCYSLVKKVR